MNERVEVQVEGSPPPRRPSGGGGGFLMMIPGFSFIGLGVAVLVWPKILQVMVAGAFMLMGLGLVFAARKVNRVRSRFSAFDVEMR